MADKVTIELEVLARKALDSVESFQRDAQKSLDSISISSAVTGIVAGFHLIGSAIDTVSGFFSHAVAEANEAEKATRSLANAMRIVGDYSEAAVEISERYAKSLSETTLYSDNQAVSALALAKSYGLVNSESRKVVSVAADLAAITGTDLNTAVEQLALTFNGQTRALAKQFPELKKLTEQQLAAGAAVDILGKKLRGSALNELDSYSGQVTKARQEVDKFYESVGNLAIGVFAKYIQWARNAKNATLEFRDALIFSSTSAKGYENIYGNIFQQVSKTIRRTARLNEEAAKEDEARKKAEKERLLELEKQHAKDVYDQVIKYRIDLLDGTQRIEADYAERSKSIEKVKNAGLFKSAKEYLEARAAVEKKYQADLAANQNKIRSESEAAEQAYQKKRADFIQKASAEPVKELVNIAFGASVSKEGAVAIGAGVLNSILKGAEGAQKAFASVAGSVADIILPGIGGVVSEIVNVLSQGPEKVREMISQFTSSIPKIIENLVQSLPVLIETLARELPPALAKTFPFLAERFAIEMVKSMPTIIQGFVSGMIEAAKQFVQTLIDTFKSAGGLFGGGKKGGKGAGPISGLGIPIISDIGSFFGLADGGRIPDLPKYEGDRFPARLNAGEQVLSKDLSSRLESFLSNGSGAPQVIKVVVGQRELAQAILDLNRSGYRTA